MGKKKEKKRASNVTNISQEGRRWRKRWPAGITHSVKKLAIIRRVEFRPGVP